MGRNRSTFTEADVKRAINAVRRAGLEIAAVEIDRDGKISIQLGRPNALHEPNEWDDSPERLRELIGGPQPSRNLSLRRQPSRAERATTEYLDWYDNVYKKLSPDEQRKIGEEMRQEYERARNERRKRKEGLRAAGFTTLAELFQSLGKTDEVRAWYDDGCPPNRKPPAQNRT